MPVFTWFLFYSIVNLLADSFALDRSFSGWISSHELIFANILQCLTPLCVFLRLDVYLSLYHSIWSSHFVWWKGVGGGGASNPVLSYWIQPPPMWQNIESNIFAVDTFMKNIYHRQIESNNYFIILNRRIEKIKVPFKFR